MLQIANAGDGKFSPDGHWLAYTDETGGEAYVTPFPGLGARIAVSSGGAGAARWREDGRELFYIRDDRPLIAAEVRIWPGFSGASAASASGFLLTAASKANF